MEIDRTRGANGTSSSLRIHVTQQDLYLYYRFPQPESLTHPTIPLPQAQGHNRMRFYIRFPDDYPVEQGDWPWHQMEVGTYLTELDYPEDHFYHFVRNQGLSDWQLVVLPNNPSLQCEQNAVDPPAIEDYYDRLAVFYVEGTAELGTAGPPSVPFDIWIDEVEFFTEPERAQCTYAGQYEFNGFRCEAGETCTGYLAPNGCCIQGGCVSQ
jgi:hypothetical protein